MENRKWPTAYRGNFAIHAGQKYDEAGFQEIRAMLDALHPPSRNEAALGAILGIARLVDCVRPEEMSVASNPWACGPWCFVLEEIVPLKTPIACKGSLSFFNVPVEAQLEIVRQLAEMAGDREGRAG